MVEIRPTFQRAYVAYYVIASIGSSPQIVMQFAIAHFSSKAHQQRLLSIDTFAGDQSVTIGSDASDSVVISEDVIVEPRHCHLEVNPDSEQGVTLTLVNSGSSIVMENGARLHRDQRMTLATPLRFCVGETYVEVMAESGRDRLDRSLACLRSRRQSTATKVESERDSESGNEVPNLPQASEKSPAPPQLAAWLETVGQLQTSIAGSDTFLANAARAVSNPGGLDGCFILKPDQSASATDGWRIAASYIPHPQQGISYRRDLVDAAVTYNATLFHDSTLANAGDPETEHATVVVSPVFNAAGEIIAVVYGFRSTMGPNHRIGVRTLEAQFVQLIAESIAAATIRMEKEAEAARSRVLLEQAFSPKVVRHLDADPHMLDGRSTEVTVLFADLRNFSSISEQAGPRLTYQMLTDVMDRFSQIIADHDGIIIDFFGDGVSAFWNAPVNQPDHALLACRAAMEMIDAMPELNQIWSSRLSRSLQMGAGIHTGIAQVGNSGSSTRLKYGPQGPTVNIASRLESMTKSVGIPLIVSDAVAEQVQSYFHARRICKVPLAGMSQPCGIYELIQPDVAVAMSKQLTEYQRCLEHFEAERFDEATAGLCQLDHDLLDQATSFLLEQSLARGRRKIDRRQNNPRLDVSALSVAEFGTT